MKIEKGQSSRKDLSVNTEEIGERTVRFTISKEVTDRDGDILRANGVDFGNYMKNPVFLGFHNSRDFPLGKVVKFWVEGDSVKADVYFPTLNELSSDMNNVSEKARLIDFCFHCYKTGMLNAVSVGFIPLEWTENQRGYDITKWELLEFSAVAVPANQDAIAEAVKSFGDDFAKGFVSVKLEKGLEEKINDCERRLEECKSTIAECEKILTEAKKELGCNDDEEKTIDISKIKIDVLEVE